jgi:phosphoglycerate dehydrogenase-like enzyme
MSKPIIVVDAFWRLIDELFTPADWAALAGMGEIVWGRDEAMPAEMLAANRARMDYYIAVRPNLTSEDLREAANLKAIIEVGGAFPANIDYAQCFARGIEVLCCAPGFRNSVAEMALAMALAGGRGLVSEHELFRTGGEHWLNDNLATDFSLYNQQVGFVGFGSIGRECARLMAPFRPVIRAYDPWLPPALAAEAGAELVGLEEVMRASRCVIVAATPTSENRGMVNAELIALMPRGSLLVVISRAHLVDFPAIEAAVRSGHIRAAVDVFPEEPMPPDAPVRSLDGMILSPHRAAAVRGGRQLIGEMIVADMRAMLAGETPSRLQRAQPDRVSLVTAAARTKSSIDMATLKRSEA